MLLSQILIDAIERFPQKLAVVCGNIRYDYTTFKTRVSKLANALNSFGIKPGDRVAIIHKNCHCFLESYFAAALAGIVIVPINYRLSKKEFTYILNNSDAKVLITHSEFRNKILPILEHTPQLTKVIWTGEFNDTEQSGKHVSYENLIKDNPPLKLPALNIPENSIAQLYYTSGTTGQPKGVVLTHKNNYAHTLGAMKELDLNESDNWLHVSPMFHLADAWAVWTITKAGGTHIIVPEFNPENVLRIMETERVTISNFIPTLLNILINHQGVDKFNYKYLRLIMSGGAPIAHEVVRKVIDIFKCEYTQTYGMTETSPFLTMSILKPHMKKLPLEEQFKYLVTTGRPFSNVQLRVINEKNYDVLRNDKEVGEIIVKGETITPEYWKLPEETSKRIKDGWLYTGDLARLNEEGYLTIVDRKDDMIITGGENVYSIEIENVLYSHPDILESAVVGLPDDIWGEKIIAVTVLKEVRILMKKILLTSVENISPILKYPKELNLLMNCQRLAQTKSPSKN
ncbi:MAG: long-chain-fatty-acid--CoA ligase [Ignavibacteria bacterium]|nr:long-chain-fatty-acid--CoA ligase [Ignavibacteria bacterium]